MDLIRIKRLKMRFSTLFQRETIPQLLHLAQACEGGEPRATKVIHGVFMETTLAGPPGSRTDAGI